MSAKRGASPWDLTALLNAADPKASLAERHLWIVRLLEWLRHAPVQSEARASAPAELGAAAPASATPAPALRLRHMLGVIERNAEHRDRVGAMLVAFLREVDSAALLADFGFAPRAGLWAEFGRRVRARILPLTPATSDLGELFALLFPPGSDAAWLSQLDAETELGWRRCWRRSPTTAATGARRSSRRSCSSPARSARPASRRCCARG